MEMHGAFWTYQPQYTYYPLLQTGCQYAKDFLFQMSSSAMYEGGTGPVGDEGI